MKKTMRPTVTSSSRTLIRMLRMISMVKTMLKIISKQIFRLKQRPSLRVTNMMTMIIKKVLREVSSKRLIISTMMTTTSTRRNMSKTKRMTIALKKKSKVI